jgi:ATP synthase I subunit
LNHPETDASLPEGNPASDSSTDALFVSSLRRMERLIPALAVIFFLALGFKAGWPLALGFLAGAAVAYVNFRWLKRTVMALADAVTQGGPHAAKPSVVLRFLTRFVLMAAAAYVIFVSYPVAFHGFLGGLFVPVLAILAETAYVVYLAIRRGF